MNGIAAASDADKDTTAASIDPFWDASETWLVLGVGILPVAFPSAHGAIPGAPACCRQMPTANG